MAYPENWAYEPHSTDHALTAEVIEQSPRGKFGQLPPSRERQRSSSANAPIRISFRPICEIEDRTVTVHLVWRTLSGCPYLLPFVPGLLAVIAVPPLHEPPENWIGAWPGLVFLA